MNTSSPSGGTFWCKLADILMTAFVNWVTRFTIELLSPDYWRSKNNIIIMTWFINNTGNSPSNKKRNYLFHLYKWLDDVKLSELFKKNHAHFRKHIRFIENLKMRRNSLNWVIRLKYHFVPQGGVKNHFEHGVCSGWCPPTSSTQAHSPNLHLLHPACTHTHTGCFFPYF